MAETIDNYRPVVGLSDLVDGMRKQMQEAGLMHSIPRQRFELAIADEIDLTREVAQKQLKKRWTHLFPGVEYSESLMLEKLDETLERWKVDAFIKFEKLAAQDVQVRLVKNILTGQSYYFRRWDARLLFASTASIVTFPVWISQILAPSNWQLSLGFWGLLVNLSLLGFLFVQTYRKQKELT